MQINESGMDNDPSRGRKEPMRLRQDRFEPGGYLTDYWTDESIKIINANKNRPFFLDLAHWGVHTPLQATREDYEAVGDIQPHRLRVYAAMIHALDRSVGRINAALEETGLAENTIVLFTGDNGGPGYLGLPDINHPFRVWKISQFEGGIRVPLLVKWPARIAAGTVSEEPVAHIDMMPTLVAAAQAPHPDGMVIDGENLLPLAAGEGVAQWSRETLFWPSGHYQNVGSGKQFFIITFSWVRVTGGCCVMPHNGIAYINKIQGCIA